MSGFILMEKTILESILYYLEWISTLGATAFGVLDGSPPDEYVHVEGMFCGEASYP
jgi:hypothetical protein